MAQDASNNINYYLVVAKTHVDHLAPLRQLKHLKVATDQDKIWVTNFSQDEIDSIAIKCIPYKTVYYNHNGKLFLLKSLLPSGKEPMFLWTPIERALPLQLGTFNHNYFGVDENITMQLVPSEANNEAGGMLVSLSKLSNCLGTLAEIRLNKLTWVLINQEKAFVFGSPLLPLDGEVYWLDRDFMIPIGYTFELYLLTEILNQKINPSRVSWVVWNTDSSYFTIDKRLLQPLTLSSFRKTIKVLATESGLIS